MVTLLAPPLGVALDRLPLLLPTGVDGTGTDPPPPSASALITLPSDNKLLLIAAPSFNRYPVDPAVAAF
jgi:hypothetical protein